MKQLFFIAIYFLFCSADMQVDSVTISADEKELAKQINAYRKEKGLVEIPISKSLTFVAQTHCKDLFKYEKEIKQGCNAHSWSKHGKWTPVNYYPDHRNGQGMWDKPRELTSYKGNGYEIECDGISSPAEALKLWKSSPAHNAVIIQSGIWKKMDWQSMGVGMYNGFAVIWFGLETDPAGYIQIK